MLKKEKKKHFNVLCTGLRCSSSFFFFFMLSICFMLALFNRNLFETIFLAIHTQQGLNNAITQGTYQVTF